jgi:hypothetical protein
MNAEFQGSKVPEFQVLRLQVQGFREPWNQELWNLEPQA